MSLLASSLRAGGVASLTGTDKGTCREDAAEASMPATRKATIAMTAFLAMAC